jgi:hypothetical protein
MENEPLKLEEHDFGLYSSLCESRSIQHIAHPQNSLIDFEITFSAHRCWESTHTHTHTHTNILQ